MISIGVHGSPKKITDYEIPAEPSRNTKSTLNVEKDGRMHSSRQGDHNKIQDPVLAKKYSQLNKAKVEAAAGRG